MLDLETMEMHEQEREYSSLLLEIDLLSHLMHPIIAHASGHGLRRKAALSEGEHQ